MNSVPNMNVLWAWCDFYGVTYLIHLSFLASALYRHDR